MSMVNGALIPVYRYTVIRVTGIITSARSFLPTCLSSSFQRLRKCNSIVFGRGRQSKHSLGVTVERIGVSIETYIVDRKVFVKPRPLKLVNSYRKVVDYYMTQCDLLNYFGLAG